MKLSRATMWELTQTHYRSRYLAEFAASIHYVAHLIRRKFRGGGHYQPKPPASQLPFLSPALPRLKVVVFANGAAFEKTAGRISQSLDRIEDVKVDLDIWSLSDIKTRSWFSKIAHFPDQPARAGRRDGYHCAYKPWVILDSMKNSASQDVVHYVDASQYYKVGFYENIQPLVGKFWNEGFSRFSGSAMPGFLESDQNWSEVNKTIFLDRLALKLGMEFFELPSLLASSMMLINNRSDLQFIEQWAEACDYETVSLNPTGEQSVLMAYIAAEKKSVLNLATDPRVRGRGFQISHSLGKNHNLVHVLFQRYGEKIFSTLDSI